VPSVRRVDSSFTCAALAVGLCAVLAASASAQKKKAATDIDGPDPKVGLTIALQVGDGRYDFAGKGVCLQIPDGSIYEAPAALYLVRHTSDKQRFNMTLYRLKSGTDMLTMNVTAGSVTHSMTTVKIKTNGVPIGSGTAKLELADKGGTLTIDAADGKGVKMTGTVKCEAFNKPVEANGH
jgi:hypothetical protein